MTIKICHMTSAHDSHDIRILEKECVSLAKIPNYEVFLVAKGSSYKYKNVNVIGIGDFEGSSRVKRIFNVSKKICRVAIDLDADIYHFHDPELLLYVKKLKQNGKKIIFDSHENSYAQILEKGYIPKYLRILVAKSYLMIENHACKYLEGAIFPCLYEGKHIFEGRVKNCGFINNVPILEEFNRYIDKKHNIKDERYIACYVGSLSESRGIENIIDACYKADVKLILGGAFSSSEFEEKMKNKREYEIVDYRGLCSREEVFEIYRQCFIGLNLLLPVGQYPKSDNLSTKVYEYMMMGMPCIISDFNYNKMIVNKYKCGIVVNPNNVDDIVNAINYIINNPKEALKMGARGKELVKEELNWDIEEKKLYDFYKKII